MIPEPLTPAELSQIEQLAEGMNRQEICDYFGWQYTELTEAHKVAFEKAFKRGRANIKFFAIGKLKEQCSNSRSGMQAALAILSQFGEEWERSGELAGVKSFKITIDE